MPVAPPSYCLEVGCSVLVSSGRCPEHERAYDRRRGTSAERLYDYRWREYSKRRLRRHPLCVLCLDEGRTTAATVTDHRIPHKGNRRLFWDRSNHQSVCAPCNTRKANREEGGFGRAPSS